MAIRYNIKKTGGIDVTGAINNKKPLITFLILLIQLFVTAVPVWATTYYYDESNRLKSVDYGQGESILFDYDNNGNLISKRSTYHSWAAAGNSHTVALVPIQVSGLTGVKAIAADAAHTAVLKEDGTVWTWGYNYYGQIGDGTTTDRLTPAQVSGLMDVKAIAAGDSHTVAVKEDGTVWAWGYNYNGQLGDGTTTDKLTPVQVNGLVL